MKLIKFPKKSLGQNFLIDNNILDKIVKTANIDKNKIILEIGAGYGNLTKKISNMNPKKIYAVEKDKELSLLLKKKFVDAKNIEIIQDDILNFIKKKKLGKKIIIFGNLPYNISTQILANLILLKDWPPWYDSMILMFQKEVADRIIAKNKSKMFGRLSVLCNWRLDIKKHFDISKNCFLPKPKINSTLLSFTPKKIKYIDYKKTEGKVAGLVILASGNIGFTDVQTLLTQLMSYFKVITNPRPAFVTADTIENNEITNEDVKKRLRELVDQTLTLATKLN